MHEAGCEKDQIAMTPARQERLCPCEGWFCNKRASGVGAVSRVSGSNEAACLSVLVAGASGRGVCDWRRTAFVRDYLFGQVRSGGRATQWGTGKGSFTSIAVHACRFAAQSNGSVL